MMQSETADFALGAAINQTERNIRVVFNSGSFASLCENMASSTKPEVHSVFHSRQKRTEPRTDVTSIKNW